MLSAVCALSFSNSKVSTVKRVNLLLAISLGGRPFYDADEQSFYAFLTKHIE